MDNPAIEIKELWFHFFDPDENPDGAAVRIQFNYMYSKFFMYEIQCKEWKTQLEEDVNDYNNIKRYLA